MPEEGAEDGGEAADLLGSLGPTYGEPRRTSFQFFLLLDPSLGLQPPPASELGVQNTRPLPQTQASKSSSLPAQIQASGYQPLHSLHRRRWRWLCCRLSWLGRAWPLGRRRNSSSSCWSSRWTQNGKAVRSGNRSVCLAGSSSAVSILVGDIVLKGLLDPVAQGNPDSPNGDPWAGIRG